MNLRGSVVMLMDSYPADPGWITLLSTNNIRKCCRQNCLSAVGNIPLST